MNANTEVVRTRLAAPRPLHRGLDGVVHRAIGRWQRRRLGEQELGTTAASLHASYTALRGITDRELQAHLDQHRSTVRRCRHRCLAAATAALPAIAEVARRELHLDPYPEQFRGALALLNGAITEMATGEGKTLTIALAAAPLGWTQLPVHIMTANDYLAHRDARNLDRFYRRCGLKTGHVLAGMPQSERARHHQADVVYTTAKELLADFLRDRLILGPWQDASQRIARQHFRRPIPAAIRFALRGLHHAIIDEADSLMIDEAVTPLIISRQAENQAMVDAVQAARTLALVLDATKDYAVEPQRRGVYLTPTGIDRARVEALRLGLSALQHPQWVQELVETSLRAELFFTRDKHYVVKDAAVIIVDEFTGRLMPGRQWKQGLHQAIEAKEGVPVSQPTESIAQLSFQTFFRFFQHVAGITGTARECADEIWAVHRRPFVAIPRHKAERACRPPPRCFARAEEKWAQIVQTIRTANNARQPVLVGTRSVASSETVARELQRQLISFNLLNAVRHKEEAAIIERAGEQGAVTIATNMAGRGTDIRLGDGVAALGGLLVIATEPHRSGRIDRQLFGRAARQGDPGRALLFLSCDDELLVDHLPGWLRWTAQRALTHRLPGAQGFGLWCFRRAQRRAERTAFRQRLAVLQQDKWIQDNVSAGRPDFGI